MANPEFLKANSDCQVKESQPAKSLTTFGIGGEAALVVEPANLYALQSVLNELRIADQDYRTIGAGSNVVFSDSGVSLPLIHLGRSFGGFVQIDSPPETIDSLELLRQRSEVRSSVFEPVGDFLVFAACPLMKFSRIVSEQSLSGLEFAAGIPASFGGAIAMNAGAHGSEMSSIVNRVFIVNSAGKLGIRSREEMDFSYRHSNVTQGEVVIAAHIRLHPGNLESIKKRRKTCLDYRKMTQPLSLPSAGSVFVNPEGKLLEKQKTFSAQLLEHVGLKGVSQGGVAYSEMHANWLVRVSENAKTDDFIKLVEQGKKLVQAEFGIELKTEIKIWE